MHGENNYLNQNGQDNIIKVVQNGTKLGEPSTAWGQLPVKAGKVRPGRLEGWVICCRCQPRLSLADSLQMMKNGDVEV